MVRKTKKLEVVVLQLPTRKRYQKNLDKLLESIKEESEKKIIVAPEVFLTGYDYDHLETAAIFSVKALKILKKSVNDQVLALTVILKDGEDFVNQAVVIHKHKVVYRQNKVKLFKMGDEDIYLTAGKKKKIKPFVIEGVSYALLICFELRFKSLWKQIEGAEVVLVLARWGEPRKKHLEVLSQALAVMNQCYVLVSNSSDPDMASSSSIVSPDAEVVINDEEERLEAEIDLREVKKMRRYIVMD
jgi:predicted amidohydrolase